VIFRKVDYPAFLTAAPITGRNLIAMRASEEPHCITKRETPHGYWWRYTHSKGESEDTWFAATGIAASIAADQARKHGKTYFVSLSVEPRAV
jgi:hypothetical protein